MAQVPSIELTQDQLDRLLATFDTDDPEAALRAWLKNTVTLRVLAVEGRALQAEANQVANDQLQALRESMPAYVPVAGDRDPI